MFLICITLIMFVAQTCSFYQPVLTIQYNKSDFQFDVDHLSRFLLCLRKQNVICLVSFEDKLNMQIVKNISTNVIYPEYTFIKGCQFISISKVFQPKNVMAVCSPIYYENSTCFLNIIFKRNVSPEISTSDMFTLYWQAQQTLMLIWYNSNLLDVTVCTTDPPYTTPTDQVITTLKTSTTTHSTLTHTSIGTNVTPTSHNIVTTTAWNYTAATSALEHSNSDSSDTTVYIVVGVLIGLAVVSSIVIICYFFIRRRQFKLKFPGIFKKKLPIKTLPDLRFHSGFNSGTQNMAFTDVDVDDDGYVKPRISSVISNVESNLKHLNNISLDTNADCDILEYQSGEELDPNNANSSDHAEKTSEYEIKNNSISNTAVDKCGKEYNAMEIIENDKEPIGMETNVESHYNNVKPNTMVVSDQTQNVFNKTRPKPNKQAGHIDHSSNNALNSEDVGLHKPDNEQRYSNVSIGKADVTETSAVTNDDSVIRIRLDVHSESAAPVDKEPIYYELEEYC